MQLWKECMRLSDLVVFCPGWIHFNWWVQNTDPIGYLIVTFKNGQNSTKVSRYQATCPYCCWGEGFKKHKFYRNAYFFNAEIYETYIQNGFLREKDYVYNHPSPKDFYAWYSMIKDLHLNLKISPKSIIYDPCAGSNPLGEVGEALGIDWEATELLDYHADWEFRINRGKEFHKKLLKQQERKIMLANLFKQTISSKE